MVRVVCVGTKPLRIFHIKNINQLKKEHNMLKLYTARAKRMTTSSLRYAIADIKATWDTDAPHTKITTDYGVKLFAEYDAYTSELFNRGKII